MLALIIFALTTPVLGVIMANNKHVQKWLVPFGAGLLLATILTHMIPEAMHHNSAERVGWAIVLGFGLCFVMSSLFVVCPHSEKNCENESHKGITWLLIVGFLIHAALDGLALFVFSNNGVRDAMAGLAIHRAVDGIALVALAKTYNVNHRTIYEWVGLIGLATIVGFLAGAIGVKLPGGMLEGFISGTMLYIIATDVIPETHKNNQREVNIVAMLTGFAVAYTISTLTAHGS